MDRAPLPDVPDAAPAGTAAVTPATLPLGATAAWRRVADYVELTKPRVVMMVLVTTVVGYYLGSAGTSDLVRLVHTLVGTALAAGGTLALNQWMERDVDARMERTRRRPLPEGRVLPIEAFVLGSALVVAGLAWLLVTVNVLCAAVTAVVVVTYLGLYTPLKQVTSACSLVGAVPGALPPVAGFAAACDRLDPLAWVLFAILFFWQIPHTLAIGQLYRDDYARGGIRVLPVVDRDGPSTATHAVTNCLALLPVALLPTFLGVVGTAYFFVALVAGLGFLWAAIGLARRGGAADARRLLVASLVYLPVLLAAMAFDKLPLMP
ncbi:MAG: heme o synthase [bacterium]|nr:heme o synthase [bacterium]